MAAAALLARVPAPLRPALDFTRRAALRFLELQGIDRAMALAGQAFAALLPLLIVIGAASPGDGRDVAQRIVEEFRLSGSAEDAVRSAMQRPAGPSDSTSVLGILLLVVSALSFTRAMQRLYVGAWRLPPLGLRGNLWGLAWLVGFVLYGALQPLIVGLFDGAVALAVSMALSTCLWLLTPWVLVGRRLPWRRLLPQAALTALALAALGVTAALYAPYAVGAAAADFGVLGVAFALLSLLFVTFAVLVITAAFGATLADSRTTPPAR